MLSLCESGYKAIQYCMEVLLGIALVTRKFALVLGKIDHKEVCGAAQKQKNCSWVSLQIFSFHDRLVVICHLLATKMIIRRFLVQYSLRSCDQVPATTCQPF